MIRTLYWITAFLVIPVIVFIEYHIGTWAPIEECISFAAIGLIVYHIFESIKGFFNRNQ